MKRKKPETALYEVPENLAIITKKEYANALSLCQEGLAYLIPLREGVGNVLTVKVEDWHYYTRSSQSEPLAAENLIPFTDKHVNCFDSRLLVALYSLIQENHDSLSPEEVVCVYVPDLLKVMGRRSNLCREQCNTLFESVKQLRRLAGVLPNADRSNLPMPVFTGLSIDVETNVLSFGSPYLARLMEILSNCKKGEPVMSFLLLPSLVSRSSCESFELVRGMVTVIEQAGRNLPHISAQTLFERNPYLQYRLEGIFSDGNRQKVIKKVYAEALKLLRSDTRLLERYESLTLPSPTDPASVPKYRHLRKTIYRFPNKGKRKE